MWRTQLQEKGVWVARALFIMLAKLCMNYMFDVRSPVARQGGTSCVYVMWAQLLGHEVTFVCMIYMFDLRSPVTGQGSMSCVYVLYALCEPSYRARD